MRNENRATRTLEPIFKREEARHLNCVSDPQQPTREKTDEC